MRSKFLSFRTWVWTLAVLPLVQFAAPAARAATDDSASLVRGVPADFFLCVQARHNPERAFLDGYWGEVFAAAKDSGVGKEAIELVGSLLGDNEKAEMDRLIGKTKTLLAGVDWCNLGSKSFIFAERLGRLSIKENNIDMAPPDIVFMFQSDAAAAAKNFDGLVALINGGLEEIPKTDGQPAIALQKSEANGVRLAGFPFFQHLDHKPYGFTLAQQGDVILVTFGEGIADEVLTLLSGKSGGKSLADGERYKAAYAKLPAAEDSQVFFDVQAMMKPIHELVSMALKAEASENASEEKKAEMQKATQIVERLLSIPEMLDYTVAVEHTDGYSTFGDCYIALAPGADKNPFYKVFDKKPASTDFARFLPEETLSFSFSTGLDISALYTYILDTIKMAGPDGEQALTEWAKLQQQQGFDLQKDVLDWFDGQITSVTLKGGTQFALFVSVRDETKAREKVARGLDLLTDMLTQASKENPMLAMLGCRRAPVQDQRLANFEYINVGMSPQPMVWGAAEGHLVFGSSADTVITCLDTAHGKHPNVRNNAQIMAEGLIPEGPVSSISLTDQRATGQQLSGMLGAFSMVSGMAAMAAPENARPVVAKVGGLLMKLVPAVSKIDFYKSSSAVTQFDGKGWTKRTVTRYASPKERPSAVAASAEAPK